MKYDYYSKNFGKDVIYQNRLKLADKLGININNTSRRVYTYLMSAELGVILN